MQRRSFMAAAAAPLAGHLHRVLTMPPRPRRRHRPRRQCAILLLVTPPANWQPTSWRDVPPASSGSPVLIVDSYAPTAIGICRSAAKKHNQRQAREGRISTWAVVAANDGRFHQGKEGGAI